MKYVLLRDDDTNATTPPAFLERLYAPFLDRGLAVNLAVIPDVRADTTDANGHLKRFVMGPSAGRPGTLPMPASPVLVEYLLDRGYHVAQHGLHHDSVEGRPEFDRMDRREVRRRLLRGQVLLAESGFPTPRAFVAPGEVVSAVALGEIARFFDVLSGCSYDPRCMPVTWLPLYLFSRVKRRPHWRVGPLTLLGHPGPLLTTTRPGTSVAGEVMRAINAEAITVLVTRWWEYFTDGVPDEGLIDVLHETADLLAACEDVRVIPFSELPAPLHYSPTAGASGASLARSRHESQ